MDEADVRATAHQGLVPVNSAGRGSARINMRFRELLEGRRPWKQYHGQRRRVQLVPPEGSRRARRALECDALVGQITTGRTETHFGYFVKIVLPDSQEIIGEDRHRLRDALWRVIEAIEKDGWTVVVIGRSPLFKETGLSVNTGFGFHPSIPDRHVHMLEPTPHDFIDN